MKRYYLFYIISFITLFIGCSDFDEQEFTVLLPDAGESQIIFTEETGTTIQLDGSGSSDVNDIGFDYLWEIIEFPEGFPATISNPSIASPILEVPFDTGGRYQLRLTTFIGDQAAFDFVNLDTNPAIAQILLVNAIDSEATASITIPAVNIIGSPVASKNADVTYHNIDTNLSTQDDGTTLIEIDYNGSIISTNENIEALKNYTIYLVGTAEAPETLLIEKTRNQNTIGLGLIGLDAVNVSEQTENVVLFIDATAFGLGILPLDAVFGALGVPEQFGALNYLDNTEIFFPTASVNPLPIWATIDGQRISNNAIIDLPGNDADFGTFILFPDASSENGNTLIFVNNTELLPL